MFQEEGFLSLGWDCSRQMKCVKVEWSAIETKKQAKFGQLYGAPLLKQGS